jgi:hypothetical protein
MDVISEPLLQVFFDGLRQQVHFARDLQQRTNKIVAEGFSAFGYIDVLEPKLSAITADLLRADGSHGQGDVFIRSFVRALGVPGRGAAPRIYTEARTQFIERNQRRIDLKLVWSDFVLGVENKPWALDQDEQIEDYVAHLQKEAGGHFLLAYLSADGSDPAPTSISRERLEELKKHGEKGGIRVLSYTQVMCQWLDECIRECQAEKVRWFLRDFRDYILQNVGGRKMSVSDDIIVAYALVNKANLELASAIAARFKEVKRSVICKFSEALENELTRRESRIKMFQNQLKSDPLYNWKGFYFGKSEWQGTFSIGIQHPGECKHFYFGVKKERKQAGRIFPGLGAKLDSVFGPGEQPTPDWDWWQYLNEYGDWGDGQVLVSMYELERGKALDDLCFRLLRVFEIAEPEIDKAVSETSHQQY